MCRTETHLETKEAAMQSMNSSEPSAQHSAGTGRPRTHSRGKQAAIIIVAALVVVAALVATLQNIGVLDLFGSVDGSRLSGNFRVTSTSDTGTTGTDTDSDSKNDADVITMKIADEQAMTLTVKGYPKGHTLQIKGTASKDKIEGNTVTYSIKNPKFGLDGEDAVKKLASLAGVSGLSDIAESLVSASITTPLKASEGTFVGTWSATVSATAAYSVSLKAVVKDDNTFSTTATMHYNGEDTTTKSTGTWKKTANGEFDLTTKESAKKYHASIAY